MEPAPPPDRAARFDGRRDLRLGGEVVMPERRASRKIVVGTGEGS
jgi:hypothetical protein